MDWWPDWWDDDSHRMLSRMLFAYWDRSKIEGSKALAIGLLGLAKLNRSIANCIFWIYCTMGQTKSTITWVTSAIDFLVIKNDKNTIHYWAIVPTKSQPFPLSPLRTDCLCMSIKQNWELIECLSALNAWVSVNIPRMLLSVHKHRWMSVNMPWTHLSVHEHHRMNMNISMWLSAPECLWVSVNTPWCDWVCINAFEEGMSALAICKKHFWLLFTIVIV